MNSKAMMMGLLVVVLSVAGCSGPDTHEKLMRDMLAMMKDVVIILEPVNDADSARAAGKQMKRLELRGKVLEARKQKLGQPTAAEKKELVAKLESEFKEVMPKFSAAIMKVHQFPELNEGMGESSPFDSFQF